MKQLWIAFAGFAKKLADFHFGVFSEPTGQASFARWAAGVMVVTGCFCVIFVTVKTHAIPELGGITGFIAAGGGVFYGANKAAFAWGSNKLEANGKPEETQ